MSLRHPIGWVFASMTLALVGCGKDTSRVSSGGVGSPDASVDSHRVVRDAAHPDGGNARPDTADSRADVASSRSDAADSGADIDAGCPNAAVDDSSKLPSGIKPPVLWFWRGIAQANLGGWYTDSTGRHCATGDTTMWFSMPDGSCSGAPACDPDHFGTTSSPCTGTDCCWRNWDDPRGPEYRVTNNTGPVSIVSSGATNSDGTKAPGYGFEVTMCAAPGTTADIDTCPRCDVHSCVESNYPQFVDQCDPVLLAVNPSKAPYPPSSAGCYSTKADITIQF